MAKFNIQLFKDILKEKTKDGSIKYSQGRVYMFISVVAYFGTLGVITYHSYHPTKDNPSVDIEYLKIIIDALKYSMMLFGGYVFGGKFIDAGKAILAPKEK